MSLLGPARTNENYPFHLGEYRRSITTSNQAAQEWFNRGLIWTYAFNHDEAAACFQTALGHDSTCAMAHWGFAHAIGPNYNKPWELFDKVELESSVQKAYSSSIEAEKYGRETTSVERMLTHALRSRYPNSVPAENCSEWNEPYAEAMKLVYDKFPDDLDVATLYAEALMNITPWALWDLKTGQPQPGARTMEAKAVLDAALKQAGGDRHPGLLHMYIHLMEQSSTPEKAMNVADCLRSLVPDGGHLNHMPTHLDVLCGEYRRSIASNIDAVKADDKYASMKGRVNFYTLYRAHDIHFVVYSAMFAGQYQVALNFATKLLDEISEELLRVESPPMADWLEGFLPIRLHVFVRFGKWREILSIPFPADEQLYSVTTATLHYARGIAYAITGEIEKAKEEQDSLKSAVRFVPRSRMLFNNYCSDILAIGVAMLDGEIEYRRGNIDEAFTSLQRAIYLDDNLPYDEPWGWMQPTRHAYGALLLEQGRIEDAAAVYKADLGFDDTLPRAYQHRNNIWSLHGYHECLVKLGKLAEANMLKPQLSMALAIADTSIKSSCFCRLDVK